MAAALRGAFQGLGALIGFGRGSRGAHEPAPFLPPYEEEESVDSLEAFLERKRAFLETSPFQTERPILQEISLMSSGSPCPKFDRVVKDFFKNNRKEAAHFFLLRIRSINQVIQTLLGSYHSLERSGTVGLVHLARTGQIGDVNLAQRDMKNAIPELVKIVLQGKRTREYDPSFVQKKFRHIPPSAFTLPNLYGLSRSALETPFSFPPIGLTNRSSNCWAAALFQLLVHCPQYRGAILNNLPEEYKELDFLVRQYFLDQGMGKNVSDTDITGLRILLHRASGGVVSDRVDVSEDASEAFSYISSALPSFRIPEGESFNPERHPRLSPLPTALLSKKTYATPGGGALPAELGADGSKQRWLHEMKWELPIPEIAHTSLELLLDRFFDDPYCAIVDDTVRFEAIAVQPVSHTLRLEDLPASFTLSLSRFRYDPLRHTKRKVHTEVDVPLTYILPPEKTLTGNSGEYILNGFIVHVGIPTGGHYIAYVRKENFWFQCNDSRISQLGSTQEESEAIVRRLAQNAYLLTYKKSRSISPEEGRRKEAVRRASFRPLGALATHSSFSPAVRAEYVIALAEQFMRAPSLENLRRFPGQLQNTLHFIRWVEDGTPDELEYGKNANERDPRRLLDITAHYFGMTGGNIIEQLWAKNVKKAWSPRAVVEDEPALYREWLERTDCDGRNLFSDSQLLSLMTHLDVKTRNEFAYQAWDASGKPDGDKAGERVLEANPRILYREKGRGEKYLDAALHRLLA